MSPPLRNRLKSYVAGSGDANISVDVLLGVGTADKSLVITTDVLSATTSLNHVKLQQWSQTENGLTQISTLIAGGFVRLISGSDVPVTRRVIGHAAQFHSLCARKTIRLAQKELQHILGGSLGISLSRFE